MNRKTVKLRQHYRTTGYITGEKVDQLNPDNKINTLYFGEDLQRDCIIKYYSFVCSYVGICPSVTFYF